MRLRSKITVALAATLLAVGLSAIPTAANASPGDCIVVESTSKRIWIMGDNGHTQWYYPGYSTCGVYRVAVDAGNGGQSGAYWCVRFRTPNFTSTYCGGIWVDIPPGTTYLKQYFVNA